MKKMLRYVVVNKAATLKTLLKDKIPRWRSGASSVLRCCTGKAAADSCFWKLSSDDTSRHRHYTVKMLASYF